MLGSKKTHAINLDQYKYILNHYIDKKDYRLSCAIILMGSRGLRVSDVVETLKINDVYDINGNLKDNITFIEKKRKSKRLIPLKGSELIENCFKEYYKTINNIDPAKQLFTNRTIHERPLTASIIKKELINFVGKMDIFQLSPHSLRKFCGKTMHENGFSVETISTYFGHKDTKTTMIYLDITPTDVLNALKLMDKNL